MKKMNISLSLLVLLVSIGMLIGCAPQQKVINAGGEQAVVGGEGGDTYATSGDVEPQGEVAVQFNDMIKPMLKDIFGGAKLNMYSSVGGKGVVLDYMVKEDITQANLASVVSGVEGNGYQKIMDIIDEESFLVEEGQEKGYIMSIEGSFNEQDIAFSILPNE